MNKSEARQIALHTIFEMEFKKEENSVEIIQTKFEPTQFKSISEEMDFYEKKMTKGQLEYVKNCINGVYKNKEEIDEIIQKYSKDWSVSRISKINLSILRLAIYEIKYIEDIPVGVSINEAVELCKQYDADQNSAFINGVLGSLVKDM